MKTVNFLIIIVVISIMFISCLNRFSCEDYRKKLEDIDINAIVVEIENDSIYGNAYIIYCSKEKKDTIYLCRNIVYEDFWNYVQIGDSILKPINTDYLIIKKSNMENKKFGVPCCDW